MMLAPTSSPDPVHTASGQSGTIVLDVLVIGGGQAGLATAYHLRSTGLRFEVLERHARIGDSWRERYDSLSLFTPRAYSALPGLSLDGDPDGYATKDEAAGYLDRYAARFARPVRMGADVRRLERVEGGFRATLADGTTIETRAVVTASRAYQLPAIPQVASGHRLRQGPLGTTEEDFGAT